MKELAYDDEGHLVGCAGCTHGEPCVCRIPTNAEPFTQAEMDAMGVCRTCGGMNGYHNGVSTGSWAHPVDDRTLTVDDEQRHRAVARLLMDMADSGKGWLQEVDGVETLVIGVTDGARVVADRLMAIREKWMGALDLKTDGPTLADLQRRYLDARGHTLSIEGMSFPDAVKAQAKYVRGEAFELQDAAWDLLSVPIGNDEETDAAGERLAHEIADVVLAATTLANLFGWDVETCIAKKTEKDRGRG